MMQDKQNNYLPDEASLDKDMTLTEHLAELRSYLLKALAALVIGTASSVYFLQDIMDVLTSAARELYYMRPAEAFMIYMKVALLSGLLLASPFMLYEFYAFARPALTWRERKFTLLCLPLALLSLSQACYFLTASSFRAAWNFFSALPQAKSIRLSRWKAIWTFCSCSSSPSASPSTCL